MELTKLVITTKTIQELQEYNIEAFEEADSKLERLKEIIKPTISFVEEQIECIKDFDSSIDCTGYEELLTELKSLRE